MFGFSLSRLPLLAIASTPSSSPTSPLTSGEWFYYRHGIYRVGIVLHLSTVLPAGLLMVWQFIPVIRQKFLLFHRINGYVVIVLTIASNVGALMIARVAFGGGLDTQAGVGTLVILTTGALGMAYVNIRRLQIDQHRAWMLRAMVYMGSIITLRIIMVLSAVIVSRIGGYWQVWSCEKLDFVQGEEGSLMDAYPQCLAAGKNATVPAEASLISGVDEKIQASLGLGFGMACWLAIFLHLIGVEIYLGLTGAEGERLRNVSYERQLEAGYKYPGSAGLTSDRWADGEEWKPSRRRDDDQT